MSKSNELPDYAVEAPDALPDYARVAVSAHTRKPRSYNRARLGLEAAGIARGVPMAATDFGIEQLPAIAATVGAFGGPTTSALAAGGGAIARQALSNEPPKPMTSGLVSGAVPAVAEEGSAASRLLDVAEQMGAARAADLLGPGMKLLGRGVSRAAMNLTPASAKVAIAERISATRFGLTKLVNKMTNVARDTKALLARANQVSTSAGAPLRWQARDIGADVAAQLTPEFEKLPIDADALGNLEKWNKQFFGRKNAQMNAQQLHEMKQRADDIARPIYRALEREEIVSPSDQAWGMYNKAIADWARERLAGKLLPDGTRVGGLPGGLAEKYAQLNARQSGLIRLKDEAFPDITKAERGGVGKRILGRTSGYQVGAMTLGGVEGARHGNSWQQRTTYGVIGSLLGAGLSSPQSLSTIALILSNPQLAKMLGLGVRAGAASVTNPESR